MKTHTLFFFLLLVIGAGCAPSTSSPSATTSFTNADAQYTGNVSGIYELASYGTVGSWTGTDILWKDSTGIVRKISGYAGKPVLLSFWVTTPDTGAWDEFSLDSVQKDLGDSVGIVTVAEDITANSFQTVYNYVTSNKIKIQVVVDTADITHIQYGEQVNPSLGLPETFILKPNGTVMTSFIGYEPERVLDSLARATYH